MRYLPSIDNLFDDFFNDDFFAPRVNNMRTDIRDVDGKYELSVELPGYNKDDVKISLDNGYLNINAEAKNDKNEKDDKDNVIRSERYHGSCSRSFYVGDEYKPEDISAKFENGELIVTLPHKEEAVENKSSYIAIE